MSDPTREALLRQRNQPLTSRRPRPRNFGNPRANRGALPLENLSIVILCVVLVILIIVSVVVAISLQDIANHDKAGCTLKNYDNHQRGFGIDNGSCFVRQSTKERSRTVSGCPPNIAHFYDAGGPEANYQPPADVCTCGTVDKPLTTTTVFVPNKKDNTTEDVLCFTVEIFDVNGVDGDCSSASLNITGSITGHDGLHCNQNHTLGEDERICSAPGQPIYFNWTTDGTTNSTGWDFTIECGLVGCTSPGFDNYDPLAKISNGTCIVTQPRGPIAASVIDACTSGTFTDSGGINETYSNNEFSQRAFTTTFNGTGVADKRLCFYFEAFDVEDDGFSNCVDFLEVVNAADNSHNGQHCNGALVLESTEVCAKHNETIYFKFSSNNDETGNGWIAQFYCVD